ncbi:MAG: hypothetical protein AAHH96_03660 [Candidatus Symbiodolus clandestinus]
MLRKVKTPKILKHLATTEFLLNPILYYLSFRVISYYQPVVMLVLPKQDLYDGKSQDFVLINQWITIKLVNVSTPLPDLQVITSLTAYPVKKWKYIEMIIYEPHRNQKIETSAKNYAIQEQENENYFQDHNNLSSSYSLEQQCKLIDDDDDYCGNGLHRRDPKLNSWYMPYDPFKGLEETIEHTLHIILTTHTCGEFVEDLAIAYAVDRLLPYCNNKDIVHQNAEILIEHYKEYYQYIPETSYIYDDVKPGSVYQQLIQDITSSLYSLREGDCFFDSLAQGMNKLSIPGGPFTVELLRQTCYEYARDNPKAVCDSRMGKTRTWSQVISEDAIGGKYVVFGNNEQDNFNSYLVRIQLTTTQGIEGISNTWGRPEIEGRMLCNKFDIKLHVVEKQTVEDEVITVHQLIDRTGSKSIDDSETATLYHNDKVLHILNEGRDHFVPILRSKVS